MSLFTVKKKDPTTSASNDEYSKALTFTEFERKADIILSKAEPGEYMLVMFEVDNFGAIISECSKADVRLILTRLTDIMSPMVTQQDGIICRLEGSHYAVLAKSMEFEEIEAFLFGISKQPINQILKHSNTSNALLNISVGICYINQPNLHLYRFMEYADLAKSSKQLSFGSTIAEFTPDMISDYQTSIEISTKMQSAINNRKFVPYLQPKVNLKTGKIQGAEILVRWEDGGETISPAKFIPVMEKNGFIGELDIYMFNETCKIWKSLQKLKIQNIKTLSVNLSRVTLLKPDLIEKLLEITGKFSISPNLIELEVTESIFSDNKDLLAEKISQLRQLGFLIAIDDFGSDYSTLTSLFQIEATTVKFDRGFIDNLSIQKGKTLLASLIIVLQNAEFSVVFEGIETQEQHDLLSDYGCDAAQGYFYARPMPLQTFLSSLQKTY